MYRWEVVLVLGALVVGLLVGAGVVFIVGGWAGLALYVGACAAGWRLARPIEAIVGWTAIVGGLVVCLWLAYATMGAAGLVLYAAVCGVGSWSDVRRLIRRR